MKKFEIAASSSRQSNTHITLMNVGFESVRFHIKTITSPISKAALKNPANTLLELSNFFCTLSITWYCS